MAEGSRLALGVPLRSGWEATLLTTRLAVLWGAPSLQLTPLGPGVCSASLVPSGLLGSGLDLPSLPAEPWSPGFLI